MKPNPFYRLVLLLPALLMLQTIPAFADRAGWNEPGREPGHDQGGLLQVNTDYFNLAAATGGDFYYWAPGEFAAAAGLLDVPLAAEPIALAYRSEGGAFTHTMNIPVDGTISRLSLFAGAQLLEDVTLLRPDGRSVEANPAGVSEQTFRHMRITTLIDPEPGLWQVVMRGAGSYELAARYQTDRTRLAELELTGIDLIDFTFVELRGRPGHQGLFPVSEPPLAGTEQPCSITLSGVHKPPMVALVSNTGAILSEVRLEVNPDASADEFIGTCRIPEQPFRAQVNGADPLGWPFQRITSGLTTPAGN